MLSATLIVAAVASTQAAEWAIDSKSQATILCGVGSQPQSDDTLVAGVGQNGVGNYANTYDAASDKWTKSENVAMMMIMDATMTKSGSASLVTGMGTAVSTDGGQTFEKSSTLLGVSQASYTYGDAGEYFAVVGGFTDTSSGSPVSSYGVATSNDLGKSWAMSSDVPEGDARYGAFPSEKTWYVSQGIWGSDEAAEEYHSVSAHVRISKKTNEAKLVRPVSKWPEVKTDVNGTGWWGSVSKTTDGGKTWSQVMRTQVNEYIYFNQISCGTVDNCVVVGEGQMDASGADRTVVYTTFDGGATWEETLGTAIGNTDAVSMMSAKFVKPDDVWVGGLAKDGRNANGQFYHSTDGGKNWNVEGSVSNCVPMDIDFGVEIGAAACISAAGGLSSVAFYR